MFVESSGIDRYGKRASASQRAPMSDQHIGQVVRLYRPDRFTIWDLDQECCFSSYTGAPDEYLSIGDFVEFELSPDGRIAEKVRMIEEERITPKQASNIVLGKGEHDHQPDGRKIRIDEGRR